MIHAISLGAGVQSSTMYRMAAEGMFDDVPDVAIFADTQAEPPWVYEQLEQLRSDHGHVIPIETVTAGSLEESIRRGMKRGRGRFVAAPFWVRNADGTRGMGRRQCTREFKIAPLHRRVRELAGLKPRQRSKGVVAEMWVGISTDEAHRMKDSVEKWVTKRYPLIEINFSRSDCLEWLRNYGFPQPGKSACYFCPYRGDAEWRAIREQAPDVWQRAVDFDADLRNGEVPMRGFQYVHDSLKPLGDARLRAHQPDLFGNECEGMCGV